MATPFQDFVNTELPKRIGTAQDPLTLAAGKFPRSTGVGLQTVFGWLPLLATEPDAAEFDNGEYVVYASGSTLNLKGKTTGGTILNEQISGGDFIPNGEKGQPLGVATLDGDGKLPSGQLPALAVSDFIGNFADIAAAVATDLSSYQKGDWLTTEEGGGKTYIAITTPPAVSADFKALKTPTDVVTSVDGETGAVQTTRPDTTITIPVPVEDTFYLSHYVQKAFKITNIRGVCKTGSCDIDILIDGASIGGAIGITGTLGNVSLSQVVNATESYAIQISNISADTTFLSITFNTSYQIA